MTEQRVQLLTTGKISELIGIPIHRINYIIKARKIPHRATAAGYRLYGNEEMGWIEKELNDLTTEQNKG